MQALMWNVQPSPKHVAHLSSPLMCLSHVDMALSMGCTGFVLLSCCVEGKCDLLLCLLLLCCPHLRGSGLRGHMLHALDGDRLSSRHSWRSLSA